MHYLAIFPPLVGFLVAGLVNKRMPDRFAQILTIVLMGISLTAGICLFYTVAINANPYYVPLFKWIEVGSFHGNWGLQLDTLSTTMIVVVTSVSFLVHVYSVGYMSHDESIPRFMSYLSLFTFTMLMLVTAPNFVQLFFGWEGVGLASYLLIGFWFEKDSAKQAALKAFVVNRVGDFGLILGVGGAFFIFNCVDFDSIFTEITPWLQNNSSFERPIIDLGLAQFDALELIAFLLFIGAMGKSAQFGLHVWLPDAMEGPTPVSALIHAATMVTAGVFMIARLSPLYELAPITRDIICFVGAFTALFAASVAITQNDIKRIIAYSTCSQLGYMFFAAGCSAYGVAMFHLVTHAFFKALLFLGAGSVIHALSDEQDLRSMGGIARFVPLTHIMMLIGNLALAGIPFFAGYYSKDAILESAFVSGSQFGMFAYVLGILVAGLTAFYSWRLLILTFYGAPRANERVMAHVHEAPLSMLIPLGVLSVGALFSGGFLADWFLSPGLEFWAGSIVVLTQNNPLEKIHNLPLYIKKIPLIFALSGIALAYFIYWKLVQKPKNFNNRKTTESLAYKISFNKWYIDELYDAAIVRPIHKMGNVFFKSGDQNLIDRFGPDGITRLSLRAAQKLSMLQTGHVYHYAFVMLVGILVFIGWIIWMGVK